MRRVPVLLAAGLALAAIGADPTVAATGRPPLAFIADVNGRVDVARTAARSSERGTLGLALQRGDKVQVGTGASATLLFNDGNLIELPEKSILTVGAPAKSGGSAPNPVMAGVFKSVSDGVVGGSRETGLVAMAPVRSGATRAGIILAPRQTEIRDERPTLRWRRVPGATRYRVTLAGDDGELWRHETGDTAIAYPADAPALPRGQDLSWTLVAASDRGPVDQEENGFRIKPAEESETIGRQLDQIEKGAGRAAPFVAGAYLGGQGLLLEAIGRFVELCRREPEQPGPHEALGQLYRAVGLTDLAAAELQKALTLSRRP